ncbi:hypothetical protein BDFB_014281 [Asbolus verrucosus]|uniref:Uncharacterized protein n=1 Tax=Asbolus verrucosus TaxID=1661398 RepID=A0A482V8V1_ASBVE|nr:hypothetical protein BDFB_014281 [Asbolus verrucosus]
MDMKKLIRDFRHFQRERQKTKLVKKKMSAFNVLNYRRGADEQSEVTVKVHQGASVNFINRNGKVFFGLYDTDIRTFDDGESDSDDTDDENEPTLGVTLIIYAEAESLILEFGSLTEKRNFLTALKTFLQFR